MSRALILLLGVMLWTPSALGHAQDTATADAATPSVDSERQARALFQSGLAHSSAERWAEAALAFEASAELVTRPSTLQNLVAALRRSGQNEAAIHAIDRYLALATTAQYAETRHQLEETRLTLERELAQQHLVQAPAAAPTQHEIEMPPSPVVAVATKARAQIPPASALGADPSTGGSRRTLAWVTLAVSAGLLATASALLLSSELGANRWRDRCATQECPEERLAAPQRSIDRKDRAGYVLFGLGAVGAVAGTTLLWLDLRAERHLKLGIAPTRATLRLRF